VGALRRVKGIVELLAAYESLIDPPPLVLIGTLERDTPRELPEGVHVVGDFPHDAVLAAMDRGLFAVFPSLWPEPLGSVVHEAMSRGLAVIGTRPGGHEDMIDDDETGLLVPRGDVGALADAMRELLDDPAKRVRLGESALLRSRLFTVAETLPQFESLYREVVGGISQTNGNASNGAGSRHGK
jgi:glycosyltransferase involved in cell wall biosynthesis